MVGDPKAAPYPWDEVLERLKTTPELLDHLLTYAHAPEAKL